MLRTYLLVVCVVMFRSAVLTILENKEKCKKAMKFRAERKENETPLRMMIQHMPGQFSRTIICVWPCAIITFDDRIGRICTLPVLH